MKCDENPVPKEQKNGDSLSYVLHYARLLSESLRSVLLILAMQLGQTSQKWYHLAEPCKKEFAKLRRVGFSSCERGRCTSQQCTEANAVYLGLGEEAGVGWG